MFVRAILLVMAAIGLAQATAAGKLIASTSYLAAHGMPTDLEELREHECVVQSNAGGSATWHLQDMSGMQKVSYQDWMPASGA